MGERKAGEGDVERGYHGQMGHTQRAEGETEASEIGAEGKH